LKNFLIVNFQIKNEHPKRNLKIEAGQAKTLIHIKGWL